MDRLTDPCWRNFDPWECCGQDYYCQRGCHDEGGCANGCIVPKLYARLAVYEDTGLMPDEVAALRAQQEAEKNEPLTLEELREMEGLPVWVQSPGIPQYGRWAIVEGVSDNGTALFLQNDFTCHDYGRVWLAYRRPPEDKP